MEEDQIFGSDISLPSLPGLESECAEELLLLMKEVDSEFKRKHSELLKELRSVRSLCRAQRDEIENLRILLMPSSEALKNDNLKECIKEQASEIEKLRKENDELKSENNTLQRRVRKLPEHEVQLESLKRSLSIQQEENKNLRERLIKVDEQYQSLQSSYQRIVNSLMSHRQRSENHGKNAMEDLSTPNLVESQITQTAEKFMSETEFCNDFHIKINQDIDSLEKKLRNEMT